MSVNRKISRSRTTLQQREPLYDVDRGDNSSSFNLDSEIDVSLNEKKRLRPSGVAHARNSSEPLSKEFNQSRQLTKQAKKRSGEASPANALQRRQTISVSSMSFKEFSAINKMKLLPTDNLESITEAQDSAQKWEAQAAGYKSIANYSRPRIPVKNKPAVNKTSASPDLKRQRTSVSRKSYGETEWTRALNSSLALLKNLQGSMFPEARSTVEQKPKLDEGAVEESLNLLNALQDSMNLGQKTVPSELETPSQKLKAPLIKKATLTQTRAGSTISQPEEAYGGSALTPLKKQPTRFSSRFSLTGSKDERISASLPRLPQRSPDLTRHATESTFLSESINTESRFNSNFGKPQSLQGIKAADKLANRFASVQAKQATSMERLQKQIILQHSQNQHKEAKLQSIDEKLVSRTSIVIEKNRLRQEEAKRKNEASINKVRQNESRIAVEKIQNQLKKQQTVIALEQKRLAEEEKKLYDRQLKQLQQQERIANAQQRAKSEAQVKKKAAIEVIKRKDIQLNQRKLEEAQFEAQKRDFVQARNQVQKQKLQNVRASELVRKSEIASNVESKNQKVNLIKEREAALSRKQANMQRQLIIEKAKMQRDLTALKLQQLN